VLLHCPFFLCTSCKEHTSETVPFSEPLNPNSLHQHQFPVIRFIIPLTFSMVQVVVLEHFSLLTLLLRLRLGCLLLAGLLCATVLMCQGYKSRSLSHTGSLFPVCISARHVFFLQLRQPCCSHPLRLAACFIFWTPGAATRLTAFLCFS
jgi:hypothetical protein